jgi:hypothetical protein
VSGAESAIYAHQTKIKVIAASLALDIPGQLKSLFKALDRKGEKTSTLSVRIRPYIISPGPEVHEDTN